MARRMNLPTLTEQERLLLQDFAGRTVTGEKIPNERFAHYELIAQTPDGWIVTPKGLRAIDRAPKAKDRSIRSYIPARHWRTRPRTGLLAPSSPALKHGARASSAGGGRRSPGGTN